jgi:chromosome partitioning protein
MAFMLAVANRKGGVGKSTVSVMLASALATWGQKRVLVFDLDSQCNASLILIGGEMWRDSHREGRTIGNYFEDLFDGLNPHPKDYLLHAVGDVVRDDGKAPVLSLLPGSLLLEDVQNELVLRQARQSTNPQVVQDRVRGRIEMLLRKFEGAFDVVILDCAPGLSAASAAAIKMANKIIVPFRPDYVSQFAVDRIASLIEGRMGPASLTQVPMASRRYAGLANFVRNNGRDRIVIDTIGYDHPLLSTELPQSPGLADAFDYLGEKMTMNEKFGADVAVVRKLYDEVRQRFAI